ncbi:hypothetical protein CFH99_00435 [Nocardioides aromaticivorans]|uniref:Uncharacterized protein n=1 Tax=Nocardioides aromaticivorans TaxID=200618 RepID=A0ABX7PDQ6_9ACTN|nr:hypothetical protein [Nocardioides aromaticivorans]QSR24093.1 hypothetical protein CFH99_00435 [Nocardioides aromaticivorans]
MSTQTSSCPVGVDELKRAWRAVTAGEFRTGPGAGKGPRGRGTTAVDNWSPAAGEHTIAVIGCAGSVGASTVALATGLAAAAPVRVVECCSVTASGLAAASTAELGLHPTDWRQGRRDHVLLERASEVLAGVDEVPLPTTDPHGAEHDTQLTILDIGWEAGQLLATDCWLAEAVRTADQLVLVTTATVPGMRRAGVAMDLLANHWQPEQIALAVRGPRRKKWPRGLEYAGGPGVRRALASDRFVEIPEDRELAVNGLDSRPVPAPLISAARQLLEPAHLTADTSESA